MIITFELWKIKGQSPSRIWNINNKKADKLIKKKKACSQIDASYPSTNVTATFFFLLHIWPNRQKKSSNIISFSFCPKASGAIALPQCSESCGLKFCMVLFACSHWMTPWEQLQMEHMCGVVVRVAVSSVCPRVTWKALIKTCFCIIIKCCALRFNYMLYIAVVLPLLITSV